ncbi:hypothetical protein E2562_011697, partial [Oryza meyeriana var. granulata]
GSSVCIVSATTQGVAPSHAVSSTPALGRASAPNLLRLHQSLASSLIGLPVYRLTTCCPLCPELPCSSRAADPWTSIASRRLGSGSILP